MTNPVEHMPWIAALFNEPVEIKDGYIVVPDRAGLGFTLNPDTIERFRIAA